MKRYLTLLLALAMIVSVFAGCGGNGSTSSTASKADTPTASTADTGDDSSSETAEVVNGTNVTGLPIVTEPVTISVAKERHMLDTTKSYNEKPAFKNLTEETGITIDWMELAAGTAAEKVPLMLSSGDLPDVFWALLSDTQVLTNEEFLVPLEDMLPVYAPNLLATYEALGTDWKTIAETPTGHVYGLLGRYESLKENTGDGIAIINKTWLDKVGKSVPTNLDELYDVLKAFKEGDPNGNGTADEIPYCFAEDMWCASIANDVGWWGLGQGAGNTTYYQIRDGVVSKTVDTDEYRAFLEYEHKLYAEGLIDQEGFSQNTETFSNKIKNNQVGLYYSWTALEYLTSEQEKDWVVMPTLQAIDGVEPVANGEVDRSTIQKNKWVITTACEHPEAALRLWDYLGRDTESKLTVALGEKGVLWDEYENGGYYFVVPTDTTPEFTFEHMKYTYGTVNDPPLLTKEETPVNDGEISPAAALRDQMVDQVNANYNAKENQLPQSYVTPEAADKLSFIATDLEAYIKEYRANAIMNGVTDSDWEAYTKRLADLRYDEYIEWYQQRYDNTLE